MKFGLVIDSNSEVLVMQRMVEPTKIERWAVVNFSARCDMTKLCNDLIRCGEMKGIVSITIYFLLHMKT